MSFESVVARLRGLEGSIYASSAYAEGSVEALELAGVIVLDPSAVDTLEKLSDVLAGLDPENHVVTNAQLVLDALRPTRRAKKRWSIVPPKKKREK